MNRPPHDPDDARRAADGDGGPPTRPVPLAPAAFGDDARYRVTGQLGSGGMGLVLRARDTLLERDVAIKLLADNLSADAGARERFLREARSAAAIHDPRVVAVHDVGEQEGRPYLVMECVEGGSLAEALAADGPLDGDDVADAAVDALAGLARAHEAGLLHRDVKPGNLLRGADGTVKVTDFGVAVAADGPALTRTGYVMGTAGYLAPERRRGEPATVATDLWALGATLLELLTDHHPGDEADAALASRGDEVPTGLRTLIDRLLTDDPAGRPASALDALPLVAEVTDPRVDDPAVGDGPAGEADADATAALTATVAEGAPAARPDATAALTAEATSALPAGEGGPGDGSAVADTAPAGTEGTRWAPVAAIAALLLAAVVVVQALSGDGDPTADPDGFRIEVDDDDPAGTARDLARQLRELADEAS